MASNTYDQASRYLLRIGPPGLLRWFYASLPSTVRFLDWLETRNIPFPGEADRIGDTVARAEDTARSDLDIALLVSSSKVADQVREDLMPLEDEQQLRISLTALTPKELAALPDDDRWWSDVVRDARILKGSAPEAAKRQVVKATA